MSAAVGPPTRVELLERRWLRILAVHGRLVDREPEVNEDGEAVVVPIPRGIEDETWDTGDVAPAPAVEGWTPGKIPSNRALAAAGLPHACGAVDWYTGGRVIYCRACKRVENRHRMQKSRVRAK